MKKLLIFESILIIFFVLAWNVSKADLNELTLKGYCESLESEINELMGFLKTDYNGTTHNMPKSSYNIMIKDEDRLYKLSVTYENLCD